MTATTTIPNTDVTGLGTASTKDAGVANGVATLDGSGTVPISQLPAAVIGALSYQGTWNASTNTPTLTSSVGTKGYYYVVSVAGSTNLNGTTDWLVGDWAVYNGTIWQKIDNTDSVTSVNGFTGAVVLTTTNVAEGTNLYYTDARARASVSAGTGISYNSTTGVITNSSPSLGGDVVGPASATDNAIARFDTTTGKLLQNSVVTVGDTGAVTGVTTLSASTSVTSPILKASNSAGGALQNASGTVQAQWGAGGGDNFAIDVSTNLNGTNAQIDISPTGTGHVHINPTGVNSIQINPTYVGTMDNITIGATTAKAITGTTITATTFSGSGSGLTGVVTSVGATSPVASSGGQTPTISMPAATTSVSGYLTSTDWNTFNSKGSGTITSVTGTAPVVSSGGTTPAISMAAANTSVNGYLTSTDWTTFNGKQAALVSGTNIKTINTNSILGSGDLTISGTPSGSTTQVQYNSSGAFAGSANLTFDGTNLTAGGVNTPNTFGFKNRVINGNMAIDQRNVGASFTVTSTGALQYTLDRWAATSNVSSKFSVQQNSGSVTPPTGFTNYLGVVSLAATTPGSSDYYMLRQILEGYNVSDLGFGTANAKTITVSFWVRSSLTGTFGGSLNASAYSRSYVFSYTINSANTWEQKTITITGDTTGTWLTTNGSGIEFNFSMGVGSTYQTTVNAWNAGAYLSATGATNVVATNGATWYVTGVQLETGTKATSFDFRDYGRELILCQRYYTKSYVPTTALGTATVSGMVGGAMALTTVGGSATSSFPVQMRTAPTMAFWDSAGNASKMTGTTNGTTMTDNLTVSPNGPFNITNNNFWFTGNGQATYAMFLHYSANAEL
jgi:hypothetical protein